ncbi:MAG: DJ-1/PfpI family protein [Bacteroidota bacterium]
MHFKSKKVRPGILLANGFNDEQFIGIMRLFDEYEIKPILISPEKEQIKSLQYFRKEIYANEEEGILIRSFYRMSNPRIHEIPILVIPGGAFSAYKLISSIEVVEFLNKAFAAKKPIAAISQAARILLELPNLNGHMLTSAPLYKEAFLEQGAFWVDSPMVSDNSFITAQNPSDLPQFLEALKEKIYKVEAEQQFIKKVSQK